MKREYIVQGQPYYKEVPDSLQAFLESYGEEACRQMLQSHVDRLVRSYISSAIRKQNAGRETIQANLNRWQPLGNRRTLGSYASIGDEERAAVGRELERSGEDDTD